MNQIQVCTQISYVALTSSMILLGATYRLYRIAKKHLREVQEDTRERTKRFQEAAEAKALADKSTCILPSGYHKGMMSIPEKA